MSVRQPPQPATGQSGVFHHAYTSAHVEEQPSWALLQGRFHKGVVMRLDSPGLMTYVIQIPASSHADADAITAVQGEFSLV